MQILKPIKRVAAELNIILSTIIVAFFISASYGSPSQDFSLVNPNLPNRIFFTPFANGAGITSEIILINPFPTVISTGKVELLDDKGMPLITGISGLGQKNSLDFIASPLALVTLTSDGQGDLVFGSVRVSSDNVVRGMMELSIPGLGTTWVRESSPAEGFVTPVRNNKIFRFEVVVAVLNTLDVELTLNFVLRSMEGCQILDGLTTKTLQANGHLLNSINALFPKARIDNFQGTLMVTSNGKMAATAFELGLGQLKTLPLAPVIAEQGDSRKVQVEVMASGLEVPWSIAFAPDGRMFFTERPGRIQVIKEGEDAPKLFATVQVAAVGEAGLLGLTLDPEFQKNHYLYIYYTYRDERGNLWNRIARFTDIEGQGVEFSILLDRIPGAFIHDGGRLRFGPDGKLYVTTGDAANPRLSQDLLSLAGKILRINPDGSIPLDNPFPNSPIFSLGHRNPQGLDWHPTTGKLFITEHGPVGDDEVNIIAPGGNYGWPDAQGIAKNPEYIDPIITFSPSVAPSGASFYKDNRLPWKGNFLFATLRGEHLHMLVLCPPEFTGVKTDRQLFKGTYGRIRDVVEGPDGALYIATSNRDGRGSPVSEDDRILRIVPARE